MITDSCKLVFDVPLGEGLVAVTVHKIHDSDYLFMRLLKVENIKESMRDLSWVNTKVSS